jgi:hypothetical protein
MNEIKSGIKDGLFHKSLGFPPGALLPWIGTVQLSHTSHSKAQCYRPECQKWVKGNIIDIPDGETLEIDRDSVVEVEVKNGEPSKALVRLQYDDNSDVCFALTAPGQGVAICKTLWTLDARDNHRSMDMGRYNKP